MTSDRADPGGQDVPSTDGGIRVLANAVPQLVWSAQADGTVDFYSDRYTEYAGFRRKDDGTWDWAPVVHPEDTEATIAAWQRAVRSGTAYDIEHRIGVADGGFRWHISRAVPLTDASGQVLRWYGSATDIHDLKSAERALRDSEARLRATFAGTADAILSVNRADGQIAVNDAFLALHRLSAAEAEHMTFDGYLDRFSFRSPEGASVPTEDLPFVRAMQSGEVLRNVALEVHARQGGFLFIGNCNTTPVRNESGALTQFVVTLHDITEHRQADERQRLLMREVDHRARNALAVVQAIMTITREETAEAFASAVRGRVQTIARSHARLSAGGWTSAPLYDLIHDELAAYWHDGSPRITIDGPPALVAATAVQPLGMVLHELTTNAVKHGALARADGALAVQWHMAEDGGLVLVWRETAPVSSPGPPTTSGTGTTVIRGSVRQLGATLDKSWKAEGLCLTIALPAGAMAVASANDHQPRQVPAPAPRSAVGQSILIIEDEAILAAEVSMMLEEAGYRTVGPAATLQEAMRMAAAEPDLAAAILDVNLGGERSWVAADILSARCIPYLFSTGYAEALPDYQGQQAPVLQKPFAADDLLRTLAGLIGEGTWPETTKPPGFPEGFDGGRGWD